MAFGPNLSWPTFLFLFLSYAQPATLAAQLPRRHTLARLPPLTTTWALAASLFISLSFSLSLPPAPPVSAPLPFPFLLPPDAACLRHCHGLRPSIPRRLHTDSSRQRPFWLLPLTFACSILRFLPPLQLSHLALHASLVPLCPIKESIGSTNPHSSSPRNYSPPSPFLSPDFKFLIRRPENLLPPFPTPSMEHHCHLLHLRHRRPAFYLVRPLLSMEDHRSSVATVIRISPLVTSSCPSTANMSTRSPSLPSLY